MGVAFGGGIQCWGLFVLAVGRAVVLCLDVDGAYGRMRWSVFMPSVIRHNGLAWDILKVLSKLESSACLLKKSSVALVIVCRHFGVMDSMVIRGDTKILVFNNHAQAKPS
jgi:hypothetical protein